MASAHVREPAKVVRALSGTHQLVVETALRYVSPGARALDLGAGSGALAERLRMAGLSIVGADIANYFELDTEFKQIDFNDPAFDSVFCPGFDLITSIEVIEHLENPTAFLRSIGRLLRTDGVAIVTTPNVENVAARVKFFLSGELRTMNRNSPEHMTPIYLDLFVRKIVPPSGLALIEHFAYPPGDFPLTGRRYFVPLFRLLGGLMRGPALTGDTHFLVLKKISRL
jgi:2-polyprenyl-3-methyl-5-hydroxy-6-metoxy-1,4-benzoquinol methylase